MRFLLLLLGAAAASAFLPAPPVSRCAPRAGRCQGHARIAMSTLDASGRVRGLNRRDLQYVAMAQGIKANMSTRKILEELHSLSEEQLEAALNSLPNLRHSLQPFSSQDRRDVQFLAMATGINASMSSRKIFEEMRSVSVEQREAAFKNLSKDKNLPQQAEKGFSTMAVHGPGKMHDKLGSVVMPIYQTSTFKFDSAEHGAACFAGEDPGYIYSRINNPTVRDLELAVAALEHGYDGIATSSGMGAITVLYMSLLSAGKHVISHKTVYGPSRALLENTMCKSFGVEASFVDTTDIEQVLAALRPETTMIYIESPANPTVSISDIPTICELVKGTGITVVVDNTFCSPYLQNPLTLGADVVVHSLTKSINGHADMIGGMIVTRDEAMYKRLRPMMVTLGTCMDANQAFLIRRGMKTLGLRMEAAQRGAMRVAEFLEGHDKIAWVRYPGLASHPQHALSKRIMRGPGAMMSFGVKGGLRSGRKLLNSVRLCVLAVSLGGIETLIQHPASMTHAKLTPEARLQGDVTDDLVRLSVGIEDADEIISDLRQALARV